MVVCTVRYEPVSTPDRLISGILQGIFANCCLLSGNATAFAALLQWLASKFPKSPNRRLEIRTGQISGLPGRTGSRGAVAELVGIEGGVVSGVINLESSGVEASDWRPRHDEHYHEV